MTSRLSNMLAATAKVNSVAWPFVVSSLSSLAFSLIDTALSGRLGVQELAGVGAAGAIFAVASQVFSSFLAGFQTLGARAAGAGDVSRLQRLVVTSLVQMIIAAVATAAAVALCALPLLRLFSADPRVVDLGATFLRLQTLCLLPLALSSPLRLFLNVSGATRYTLYVSLITDLMDLLFSYLLGYGALGFPKLGVAGLALGTTIGTTSGLFFLIAIFARRRPLSLRGIWPSWRQLLEMHRISWPETINVLGDYLGNVAFVAIVGLLGTLMLAGSRVTFSLLMVVFVVAMNFGVAFQILIGRSIGAGNIAAAMERFKLAVVGTTLQFLIISAVFLLIAYLALPWVTPSLEVAGAVAPTLLVIAAMTPLMAVMCTAVGFLRASGKTFPVMVGNVGAVWLVQLPAGYLLATFGETLWGVYLSYLFYFGARTLHLRPYLVAEIAALTVAKGDADATS